MSHLLQTMQSDCLVSKLAGVPESSELSLVFLFGMRNCVIKLLFFCKRFYCLEQYYRLIQYAYIFSALPFIPEGWQLLRLRAGDSASP